LPLRLPRRQAAPSFQNGILTLPDKPILDRIGQQLPPRPADDPAAERPGPGAAVQEGVAPPLSDWPAADRTADATARHAAGLAALLVGVGMICAESDRPEGFARIYNFVQ